VRLDRADRQSQLGGNGFVAHAEHHVAQNVALPPRQGLLLHAVGYTARYERPQGDATQKHGPQSGRQVLQSATEQQITAGALFEGMADLRFTIAVRENHDTAAVRRACGNQTQPRVVISDHNIGRWQEPRPARHHLKLPHSPQRGLESRRDQRIGVHDQHLDSVVGTHSCSPNTSVSQ